MLTLAGRELLGKVGGWLVKLLAGLLALSWAGLIFPMTLAGTVASVLSALGIIFLYLRSPTLKVAIVSLVICGGVIAGTNTLSVRLFSGPIYLFRCSTVSISCAYTHQITAFEREVLIVPVWVLKMPVMSFLMSGRELTYEPHMVQANGLTILHAPFEEQAILELAPGGLHREYLLNFPLNAPMARLDFKPKVPSGYRIEFNIFTRLAEGIEFRSNLSNATPGQFSIVSSTEPGLDSWRRLVFSNELIRSIVKDDAALVLSELEREADRTDLREDYIRFEAIKITADRAYYSGLAGETQRFFNIRSAIATIGEHGDFKVSPEAPWNRTFVLSAFHSLVAMGVSHDDASGEQARRLASPRVNRLPWDAEAAWLREKAAPALAGAKSERLIKALLEAMSDGSVQSVADAYSRLAEVDPPDEERQQAMKLLSPTDRPFEELLGEWMRKAPSGQRAYRLEVMRDVITRETTRAMHVGMSDTLGGFAERPSLEQRAPAYSRLMEITEFVRSNEQKKGVLKRFAVTELQRLKVEDASAPWDALLQAFKQAMLCDDGSGGCDEVVTDLASKWFPAGSGRPRSFEIFLQLATRPEGASNLIPALPVIFNKLGRQRSFGELDQVALPVILLILHGEGRLSPMQKNQVCKGADTYSSALMAASDMRSRIFQHEGAILLADLCRREWGRLHKLVLAKADLGPGLWISIVLEEARRASQTEQPIP